VGFVKPRQLTAPMRIALGDTFVAFGVQLEEVVICVVLGMVAQAGYVRVLPQVRIARLGIATLVLILGLADVVG